jgi:hypothetical protein
MPLQFFTNTWISRYEELTKKDLVKILGYTPAKGFKDDIRLLIFQEEYSRYIIENFRKGDFTLNIPRCNNSRKQRYIFQNDLENLSNKIDKSLAQNIKEILWVNKERSLSELFDGRFLLTQVKEFGSSKINPYENTFSNNILELINKKMSPMTYYLYRKDTDLVDKLYDKRDLNYKYQYYYSMDDLLYLRMLFIFYDKTLNVNKDFLSKNNTEFDRLQDFDKVYWSDIHYTDEKRSYVLYKTKSNIYTLVKFSVRIEENKVRSIALKWPKIYLASDYDNLIEWCLTNDEYKIYMNLKEYKNS